MSLPIPKLDTKDFEELFLEARSKIIQYAPEWTNHNLSDPAITIIDLLAWLADMQIYSVDRITDYHKRKFLKLLGTTPASATIAETDVTFSLNKDCPSVTLKSGTLVFSRNNKTNNKEYFETVNDVTITDAKLETIMLKNKNIWREISQADLQKKGFITPFSNNTGSHEAIFLGIQTIDNNNNLYIKINLYEEDLPECKKNDGSYEIPSVKLQWQIWTGKEWKELNVEDKSSGFNHSGYVILTGLSVGNDIALGNIPECGNAPKTNALVWIKITPVDNTNDRYEIAPRIESFLFNTTLVKNSKTWNDSKQIIAPGLPDYKINLDEYPVIKGSVKLLIDNITWNEVDDIDTSDPFSLHFMLDCQKGILMFGNGDHGMIPPENSTITIEEYKTGGGRKGNVSTGQIMFTENERRVTVINTKNAHGGIEAETTDSALERVRRERKKPTRLLNENDIETLVWQTPGKRFSSVKVLSGYHPVMKNVQLPSTITIVVVPFLYGNSRLPVPCNAFLETVRKYLKDKCLIGTEIHVVGPDFIAVSVFTKIKIKNRCSKEKISIEAEEKINQFLDPVSGGQEKKGWVLGRPVYTNEIIAELLTIEGVICIDSISLNNDSATVPNESIIIPKTGLVYPAFHRIEIVPETI